MNKLLCALTAAKKEGRLHHSYILAGPESPLKREIIETFFSSLESSSGLSSDASFQIIERVRRGNHPDFLCIQAVDSTIGVESMRALPKALAYAPLQSEKRVVVIEDAASMNVQAANALLKILEEPPAHTMFFLLCREPTDLLPTVLSRSQILRFPPLSSEELMVLLQKEFSESSEVEITRASRLSGGSFERAKKFLQLEDGAELFQRACNELIGFWELSPRVPSSMVQWMESLSDANSILWVVDIWELLLRDFSMALTKAQEHSSCLPECREKIELLAKKWENISADTVSGKKEYLNRFRVYREFNGNIKLDFLALIHDLNFSVGKKA